MGRARPPKASHHVEKYLARNEAIVLEMKQHWARLIPAILCCLTGLVLTITAGLLAPQSVTMLTNLAWWIWLILVGHLVWRVLEWRDETFVITNRRLILVHGMFVKKVAMMPLSKVTDMSYNRSVLGRLLGYGTYVMESAGQDQALSTIEYVRHPDAIYRDLCALIFGEEPAPEDPDDEDYDDEYHDNDADSTDPFGTYAHESVTDPATGSRRRSRGGYDHLTTEHIGNDEEDDGSSWSVSREHATRPQPVRRSRHPD